MIEKVQTGAVRDIDKNLLRSERPLVRESLVGKEFIAKCQEKIQFDAGHVRKE